MFKIIPREPELARDGGGGRRHNLPRPSLDAFPDRDEAHPADTHIFTGQPPLPRDGRIWMARDLTDPLLHSILFPGSPDEPPANFLREKCEVVSDGWYGNGAIAKVKTIMRNKIQALIEERVPDDADYARILSFPDHAGTDEDIARFFVFDPKLVSNRDLLLATELRSAIKGSPNWRGVKKEKREGGKEDEGEGEEEELERAELVDTAVGEENGDEEG